MFSSDFLRWLEWQPVSPSLRIMDTEPLIAHKLRNNLQQAALLFVLASLMGYC